MDEWEYVLLPFLPSISCYIWALCAMVENDVMRLVTVLLNANVYGLVA